MAFIIASFYKELRDSDGNLNFDLDAQKSVHYVFSNQYKFYMGATLQAKLSDKGTCHFNCFKFVYY